MYGGIYRDVWLIVTDNVFVPEGIHAWAEEWKDQGGHFVTFSDVSAASATVTVRTWVKNSSKESAGVKLITAIVDSKNQIVKSSETSPQSIAAGSVVRFTQQFKVDNPKLWYPWSPYLYNVHSIVYNGDKACDRYSTRIGVRSIQFIRSEGMKCNGTTIKLLGLNRHQTWPFVGHAVPNNQQRRDAELLKEAACNFARCSHYLLDDAFMDACDELGILLWVEIPGWHCCNNDGRPSTDATWRKRHYDETRFMVRTVRTPESPAAIRLTAEPPRLEANGGDFSRVIAEIVDINGTYVPYSSNSIKFEVSGTGTLIGDNPFKAQSGVAMNLVKAQLTAGTITVTATSNGLAAGKTVIEAGQPSTTILDFSPSLFSSSSAAFRHTEVIIRSVSDIIHLKKISAGTVAHITVYDLKGRIVYRQVTRKPVLDLAADAKLPGGTRIVKIKSVAQWTERPHIPE